MTFLFLHNKLFLSQSTQVKCNSNLCHVILYSDAWCSGHIIVRQLIILNDFDDRLWFRQYKINKTTFETVCDEIGPLSCEIFCCISRNLFSKCFYIVVYVHAYFSGAYVFYAYLGISVQRFLCNTPKLALKYEHENTVIDVFEPWDLISDCSFLQVDTLSWSWRMSES